MNFAHSNYLIMNIKHANEKEHEKCYYLNIFEKQGESESLFFYSSYFINNCFAFMLNKLAKITHSSSAYNVTRI